MLHTPLTGRSPPSPYGRDTVTLAWTERMSLIEFIVGEPDMTNNHKCLSDLMLQVNHDKPWVLELTLSQMRLGHSRSFHSLVRTRWWICLPNSSGCTDHYCTATQVLDVLFSYPLRMTHANNGMIVDVHCSLSVHSDLLVSCNVLFYCPTRDQNLAMKLTE